MRVVEGIWRDDEHSLLVQLYDEKVVHMDRIPYRDTVMSVMAWMIDRKNDCPLIGAFLISVMPKRGVMLYVRTSKEHGPGVYFIECEVRGPYEGV